MELELEYPCVLSSLSFSACVLSGALVHPVSAAVQVIIAPNATRESELLRLDLFVLFMFV